MVSGGDVRDPRDIVERIGEMNKPRYFSMATEPDELAAWQSIANRAARAITVLLRKPNTSQVETPPDGELTVSDDGWLLLRFPTHDVPIAHLNSLEWAERWKDAKDVRDFVSRLRALPTERSWESRWRTFTRSILELTQSDDPEHRTMGLAILADMKVVEEEIPIAAEVIKYYDFTDAVTTPSVGYQDEGGDPTEGSEDERSKELRVDVAVGESAEALATRREDGRGDSPEGGTAPEKAGTRAGSPAILDQRFLDQLSALERIGYTLTRREHVEELARLRASPSEEAETRYTRREMAEILLAEGSKMDGEHGFYFGFVSSWLRRSHEREEGT